MIIVAVLLLVVVGVLVTVPYWGGRALVRNRTWLVRDRVFDDLIDRRCTNDLMWGLVERCDLMLKHSGTFTPISVAATWKVAKSAPRPEMVAFPTEQMLSALDQSDRAYHDEVTQELTKLMVLQLLVTSWSGLLVLTGLLVVFVISLIVKVFWRDGSRPRRRGARWAAESLGDEGEQVLIAVSGGGTSLHLAP